MWLNERRNPFARSATSQGEALLHELLCNSLHAPKVRFISKGRVFAFSEDIRAFRLESELSDLQAGYVNRFPRLKPRKACSKRDHRLQNKNRPRGSVVVLARVDKKDVIIFLFFDTNNTFRQEIVCHDVLQDCLLQDLLRSEYSQCICFLQFVPISLHNLDDTKRSLLLLEFY